MRDIFFSEPSNIKSWFNSKGYSGSLHDSAMAYFSRGNAANGNVQDYIMETLGNRGCGGTLHDRLTNFFQRKTNKSNRKDAERAFFANTSLDFFDFYTGQFCTRACILTANTAAGTATKIMSKTRHIARATVNSFQIGYPNWYVNSSFNEVGNGGTATITAAIEYPIGGTITQVTWSSSSSTTIASGAQSTLSDAINIVIPNGDAFIVRTLYSNASGIIHYQLSGQNQIDSTNSEQSRQAAGAITDQTMVAGAYTSGSASVLNYGPNVLVANVYTPSIAIMGDSRQVGQSDTYIGYASTDKGQMPRCVGPYFPYINISRSAMGVGDFLGGVHTNQLALAVYCSHIISGQGFNDLSGEARPVADVQTDIQTFAALFSTQPFYQTTLPPKSTSTDSWATLANQTSTSGVPNIHTFNNWVRAGGITGVSGYFEVADAAEGTRDSGKWIVNGSANYATNDGIHESQALNVLYISSNVFNPSLIYR